MKHHWLVTFAVLAFSGSAAWPAWATDDPPAAEKPKYTNKLAGESSPYLLQHAHNPVNWHPWGQEAFDKAKKEGKLVFLSIGYSSCHWCHVMEKESFEDEATAKLMNDWYVCIKVDREERPDIDRLYMTALETLSQSGGWPLSMFLTAEAKPIVGGTYWPREDKEIGGQKSRGFKTLLKVVHEYAVEHPKELKEQADKLADATQHNLEGALRGIALVKLDRELIKGVVDGLKEEFDKTYGGFGASERKFQGPKFPRTPSLLFLQNEAGRHKDADLASFISLTLDRMAQGGIYDHIGGGFHRYAVERTWTVPHFEKMLYDNAQLVEVYARAYESARNPAYKRVVEETLAFVDQELTSPEGGFYCALDADAAGSEGRFYVWAEEEVNGLLGKNAGAGLFKEIYGMSGPANFESQFHILLLKESMADAAKAQGLTEDALIDKLKPFKARLLQERSKRPRPALDNKILTAWNGQMIAAYARAGKALAEPAYTAKAQKAAEFILKNLKTKDGRILRVLAARPGDKAMPRIDGYLDDYAFFVHGLLNLHEFTGEKRWLEEARQITDQMIKHFGDKKGGYFYTAADHEKLFARSKEQFDGAQPSSNSMAALNLIRLGRATKEEKYRAEAEKTFQAFAGLLRANPTALPAMAEALALHLESGGGKSK